MYGSIEYDFTKKFSLNFFIMSLSKEIFFLETCFCMICCITRIRNRKKDWWGRMEFYDCVQLLRIQFVKVWWRYNVLNIQLLYKNSQEIQQNQGMFHNLKTHLAYRHTQTHNLKKFGENTSLQTFFWKFQK